MNERDKDKGKRSRRERIEEKKREEKTECKNQRLNTIRSKKDHPASRFSFRGSDKILALCSSGLSLCPSLSRLLAPAKESDPKLS